MLDGLFRPGSVAVIGASNNPYSIGHIVIKNLAQYGFKGPIYPDQSQGALASAASSASSRCSTCRTRSTS